MTISRTAAGRACSRVAIWAGRRGTACQSKSVARRSDAWFRTICRFAFWCGSDVWTRRTFGTKKMSGGIQQVDIINLHGAWRRRGSGVAWRRTNGGEDGSDRRVPRQRRGTGSLAKYGRRRRTFKTEEAALRSLVRNQRRNCCVIAGVTRVARGRIWAVARAHRARGIGVAALACGVAPAGRGQITAWLSITSLNQTACSHRRAGRRKRHP